MPAIKQVGDRVGPYVLTAVLGEGGAGQVFRASWDPDDPQRAAAPADHPPEVAIKLLRSAHAGSEAIFRRFVREIGLAQRIHHPHIVQHLDSGLAEDFLYYAMELVPYGSLRDVLQKRGCLPWRDAVESALHIAEALACLHDAGVVHRDLKPDNVFLSEKGGLKLGDFGLAKTEDGAQITMAGQTVGSVRYMAPEQVQGQRDLDGRCDLYALGCVLMEMPAGRPPFESTDPMVVFYKHAEEPPPRLRSLVPGAPASLDELVDRLLEKEKRDRPPSAHAVRAALQAIHAAESGEVEDLDALLSGEVAPIEAAPDAYDEDAEDDQQPSLAGMSTSPIGGGLTGGSLGWPESDEQDPDDQESNNQQPDDQQPGDPEPTAASVTPRENRSDLSQRLATGEPDRSLETNRPALIAAVLVVLLGLGMLFATLSYGDRPPAANPPADGPAANQPAAEEPATEEP